MTSPPGHRLLLLTVVTGVVALDQATKALVRTGMSPGERIPLLGELLALSHTTNRGIAWGMLSTSELRLPFMTAVSLITFVVLGAWFRRLTADERPLAWTLALLLAGALGNFIDRLLYREVTDFLAVSLVVAWPVFNIADIAITVGIVLFAANLAGRAPSARAP